MGTTTQLPIQAALLELQDYTAALDGGICDTHNLQQIAGQAERLVVTLPEWYQKQLTEMFEDKLGKFAPSDASYFAEQHEQLTALLQGIACSLPASSLVWLVRERFRQSTPPWMFSLRRPLAKCMFCSNLPRPNSDQCARCYMLECVRMMGIGYGDD